MVVVLFANCSFNEKYYYIEDNDEPVVIEAASDSSAYMDAFKKFRLAVEAHEAVRKATGGSLTEAPSQFTLLNHDKKDITYTTFFTTKERFEEETTKSIKKTTDRLGERLAENNKKIEMSDTAKLYDAPVKILSAKFVTKEYSNYKGVFLSYKNVSGKSIAAIRFKWYGENAFGEPADMSGPRDGWGGGFTDDVLNPGRTDNGTWDILSKDGKKIITAYPYEVAFTDGSKWTLKDN